jgi:hypothetical protein
VFGDKARIGKTEAISVLRVLFLKLLKFSLMPWKRNQDANVRFEIRGLTSVLLEIKVILDVALCSSRCEDCCSSRTDCSWSWSRCEVLKRRDLFAQRHSVTSQKIWFFKLWSIFGKLGIPINGDSSSCVRDIFSWHAYMARPPCHPLPPSHFSLLSSSKKLRYNLFPTLTIVGRYSSRLSFAAWESGGINGKQTLSSISNCS